MSETEQVRSTEPTARRAVNLRSVTLGLAGVLFICGLTAYNDYVVANTYLVGNFLPIGLLLFFLAFVLLVNGPLQKFAPRLALSTGEVGVAMCMMMVSCALPSSGLMRYLPAQLIAPWAQASTNAEYASVLKDANLPEYLFPEFTEKAPASDPVVKDYWQRAPLTDPSFASRVGAVPWGAWIRPAAVWGSLVALVLLGLLCLSVVFRRQWAENERLPYPLASVYLSLIEAPAPGRVLNSLFSSKLFWASAAGVFVIHGFNAMHQYYPRVWPEIPISYKLGSIFGNPPFVYMDWGFKNATLYFCMVGITYFLQANVALSLWLCYVVLQVIRMSYGTYQADFSAGMQQDQNFGSILVFAASVLFIGRHHLLTVVKQMFRRPHEGELRGRYLPYFIAGWGVVLSAVGIAIWMMAAGATFGAALLFVGMGGVLCLVVARVVAETGLIFVQSIVPVVRPWHLMAQSLPEAVAFKTSVKSFFMTSWLGEIFVQDVRESAAGFMSQGLRVADGAAYEKETNWKRVLPFTLSLVGALVVGFAVSGASMLFVEYNYATTADRNATMVNEYAMQNSAKSVLDKTRDYRAKGGPTESHSRWTHIGVGGAATGILSALRLRFASWPIHPVGYLLMYTWPMRMIWFSIFVGWLVKVLIVKYGGSGMYRAIKPLFLGLIIGEVGAAAFWLVVSLVLNSMGLPYQAIRLLPT